MKPLKILFQEPFVPRSITYGIYHAVGGNNTFPYGVACLARYLKDRGHKISYLDPSIENMTKNEYCNYLHTHAFDVVGIGSTTIQVEFAFNTFHLVKQHRPSTVTILGGVHGTLMPMETMADCPHIDFIVLNEAEKPLSRLLECLASDKTTSIATLPGICWREDGQVRLNNFDPSDRLPSDEFPMPLHDIFPMRRYKPQITFAKSFPCYTVIASRGCPFNCAFCNAGDVLGRKARFKPVPLVIEEMRTLKVKYGAKGIMFLDSTFTVNRQWVKSFCEQYAKSGVTLPWSCNSRVDTIDKGLALSMRKAGCWEVSFGIESGNQKSLDAINKQTTLEQARRAVKICLESGLFVYTTYILCLPGETVQDVEKTIAFARSLGNQMAFFYLPVPFPRTGLAAMCKETGLMNEAVSWRDYNTWDYSNPVYINPLIGKDEMMRLLSKAFWRFYINPLVWLRNAKELFLLRQSPYKYWLGLKGVLLSLFKLRAA